MSDLVVDCDVSGECPGGAGGIAVARQTSYGTMVAGADAGVVYWVDLVGEPVERVVLLEENQKQVPRQRTARNDKAIRGG